jgi:hypothetical protein
MMEQDEKSPRPPWWFAPLVFAALGVVAFGLAILAWRLAG